MAANSKKLSNVRTLLVVFGILILIMVAVYYYLFQQLGDTGIKISTLTNETDSLIGEETNLNSLRAVFSATTNEREKINSYFIGSDGTVDFLTDIENVATFAGLENDTKSVETVEEEPISSNRQWLHIIFTTEGSWQNTYYFISMLESLPFNIVIHRIDLHATGNNSVAAPTGESASSTESGIRSSGWEATYDFSVKKMK